MTSRYIYLLAMGHFFCDIAMGALPAILPFFIAAYGMDYKDVGGLMFASSFLSSVIQPLLWARNPLTAATMPTRSGHERERV